MKPQAQTSGIWRSVESITGFGFGASFASSYYTCKGGSIPLIPGSESRQGASALMTKKTFAASYDVILSTVTFSRYVSGISFVTLLVGFQCFHSVVFSVGNEPTVPRAGLPSAECEGS